jgi:hypothetical protein
VPTPTLVHDQVRAIEPRLDLVGEEEKATAMHAAPVWNLPATREFVHAASGKTEVLRDLINCPQGGCHYRASPTARARRWQTQQYLTPLDSTKCSA